MACEDCKLRSKYDDNPKSFLGRLWRWHIKFCPGWKAYYKDLPEEKKQDLSEQYSLK